MPERVLLRVTGEDARSWLHGQVTNKTAELEQGQTTYALFLNLKGKVIADAFVLAEDTGDDEETFLLCLPAETVDALLEHLDRFIIMEDVELERDAREVVAVGPGHEGEAVAWDWLGDGGRSLLLTPGEVPASEGVALSTGDWERMRLQRGVPRFGVDFGDFTLPQEAGLKERAVSFNKGCYQGQEAVVMLEHRGSPPKTLLRLKIDGVEPLEVGEALLDSEGQTVGELRSSASDHESGVVWALGYVKRKKSPPASVAGRSLQILA